MIDVSRVRCRTAGTDYLVWAVPDCFRSDNEFELVSAKMSPRRAVDEFMGRMAVDPDEHFPRVEVLVHDPESGEVFCFPVKIPNGKHQVQAGKARRVGGAE